MYTSTHPHTETTNFTWFAKSATPQERISISEKIYQSVSLTKAQNRNPFQYPFPKFFSYKFLYTDTGINKAEGGCYSSICSKPKSCVKIICQSLEWLDSLCLTCFIFFLFPLQHLLEEFLWSVCTSFAVNSQIGSYNFLD